MRKLIINDIAFDMTLPEKIEKTALAGWDGMFTGWDREKGNKHIAALIKDAGLIYQSIHAPFEHCDRLWEKDRVADDEEAMLTKCLQDASDAGVGIVVMHAIIGMDKNTPNETGVERFYRLAEKALHLGVKIAVENTEGESYLDAVINALNGHPAIGYCIDTGHEMCYNHCHDIIGRFGRKIIATHLNDNMKMTGEKLTWLDGSHMMPFDGLADWQSIVLRLKKAEYTGPLTFELVPVNRPGRHTHDIYSALSPDEFLSLALTKAKKLRQLFDEK